MLALAMPVKAQTYVLDEGFEGSAFPPDGWSVIDADGDGHCWQQGGTGLTRGSGDKIAVSYTVDGPTNTAYGTQKNYLVTPKINVKNRYYSLGLSFIAEDVETDEHITVLVSTTGNRESDFTDTLYDATASNLSDGEVKVNSLSRSLSAYSGKAIYIAILHTGTDTYALGIDDVRIINQKGPKWVTSFKAVAGAGSSPSALLSWTNPTANGNGEPLTSLGINIYRDGTLIKALNNQKAGEASSYEDTTAPAGNHTYAVAAVTDEGESRRRQATIYVGEDIPGTATDVVAKVQNGEAFITWNAPAKGKNKGLVIPGNLKYNILKFTSSDTTIVAEGITSTSCKAALDDGILTGFLIAASNTVGTGDNARSNMVVGFAGGKKDIAVGGDATADYRHKRLPINMYATRSVSETVYYPSELKFATGTISHIIYKNHFRKGTETKCPVKVYMGETTQRDLSAGWIPSKDLQLVYDDSLTLHENDNDVPVKLTTPYYYNGGNLVVMVSHEKPSLSGTYFDIFYVSPSADHDKRSRSYDTTAGEDLDALTASNGDLVGEVPQTRFIITTDNMTALAGRITDEDGNAVAHAKLKVRLLNVEAESDDNGNYAFDMLPSGQTTIEVSATGYAGQTVSMNLSGDAMTRNITLKALAKATLTGTVTASDNNASLGGAKVSLDGYASFETTTSADGRFAIDGVYVGQSYRMTINYPDYDVDSRTISPTGNMSFGTIELTRSLIPPFDVQAENDAKANDVLLTWKAPNKRAGRIQHTSIGASGVHSDTSKDYSYTDYYVAHAWSAKDLQDSAMVGMSFKAVSAWLKASDGSFSACVWKGDKNNHVLLAEKSIPLSAISANGGWVAADLDEPVEIRQGESYMVGIHIKNASGEPIGVNYSSSATLSGRNNVKFSDEGYAYDGYYPYNISAYVGIPGTETATDSLSSAPAPSYYVYRGSKSGENLSWTRLTALPVEQTHFTDKGWNSLPSGTYVYRVDAAYHGGTSEAAYSDSIARSLDYDAGVSVFVSPVKSNIVVSHAVITVKIKNYGEKALTKVPVSCRLNDGTVFSKVYNGNIVKGDEAEIELCDIPMPAQAIAMVSAWTALSGDEDTSNDTLSVNIPNYSDEIIGAFRWDAYGNSGAALFHANTPEQMALVKEVTPDDALVTAGTMTGNGYLAFTATWSGSPKQLMVMDTTTWTPLRSAAMESYFLDMTTDDKSGKVYALAVGDDGTELVTIDPLSLCVSTIGSTSRDLHTLAFAEGKLYGIDSNGMLCGINVSTAAVSEIGFTGISDVRYLQSMVWMPKSGRMLWVQTGAESIGRVYQVDLMKATATSLGQVVYDGYGSEMVGLYVLGGSTATGVSTIGVDNQKGTTAVYSPSGVRRPVVGTGLNIVRNADGTVRKVIRR